MTHAFEGRSVEYKIEKHKKSSTKAYLGKIIMEKTSENET